MVYVPPQGNGQKVALGNLKIAANSLIHINSAGAAQRIADVASGQMLNSQGVSSTPVWTGTPTLTSLTVTTLSLVGTISGRSTSSLFIDAGDDGVTPRQLNLRTFDGAGGSIQNRLILTAGAATTEVQIVNANLRINALSIITDTTTGLKIATTTGQKVAFHGVTPSVQAAHIADPSGGATVDAEARTAINAMLVVLENKGFTAAS